MILKYSKIQKIRKKNIEKQPLRYEITFKFLHEKNVIKSMLKFCFLPTTLAKQQKLENWQGCDKTDIHVLCVMRIKIDTILSEKSMAISSKTKLWNIHYPATQKFHLE